MNAPAPRRVCLQIGFGLGQAFLQAWHDWRQDPQRTPRLDFIAITPRPPGAAALRGVPGWHASAETRTCTAWPSTMHGTVVRRWAAGSVA